MAQTLILSPAQVSTGLKIVGGSLLIGLCSQIAIPLPFTPVPLALGSMAPLFLGALMGKRLAFWAVFLFLVEGALGLPVFSLGGSGLTRLLGPSGGYLMGYAVAAYLTGHLVEKNSPSPRKTFLAMVTGSFVILCMGAMHLASFVGIKGALYMGVLPFLAGDLVLKPLCALGLQRKA